MNQVRIVVHTKIQPLAYELMEVTQVGNLSDLFSLLVSRYASHLKSTWIVDGDYYAQKPKTDVTNMEKEQGLKEVELEHTLDPALIRLSQYLEEF
jgi:hypothetical protein